MKKAANFLICSLLAFCAVPASAEVSFIYPAPKTWVTRSNYFIFKLNEPQASHIKITVNGIPSDLLHVGNPEYKKAFKDFVIVQPIWDAGKNDITVETFNKGERLASAVTDIYYAPEIGGAAVPPEYKEMTMHLPEVEKLCASCHVMMPTEKQLNALGSENPCYSCHKGILKSKFVHGPAGTFSCNYCHDVKGSPRYAVSRRDAAVCSDCHDQEAKRFSKYKYQHGPIAAGMCEVCHDPHGSQYSAQLRGEINQVCLSCHEPVSKQPHVVRVANGEGHILSGKQDPSRPATAREMSCISCHNPHGSDVRYFFVNGAESRFQLCQMCHNK